MNGKVMRQLTRWEAMFSSSATNSLALCCPRTAAQALPLHSAARSFLNRHSLFFGGGGRSEIVIESIIHDECYEMGQASRLVNVNVKGWVNSSISWLWRIRALSALAVPWVWHNYCLV